MRSIRKKIGYANRKFTIIQPYVQGKEVLDIGVVQHDIGATEKETWLHGLLAKHAKSIVGIDIDKERVEYLKKRGFDILLRDAQNFDLGRKFDVIVAGDIIEHLVNFEGFLKSIKKHMRKDGLLIITTPNVFFYRRFLQTLFRGRPILNPEHTCWFDEETIRQLVSRYGLEVKKIVYSANEGWFRFIPLPKKLKYTTMMFFIQKKED